MTQTSAFDSCGTIGAYALLSGQVVSNISDPSARPQQQTKVSFKVTSNMDGTLLTSRNESYPPYSLFGDYGGKELFNTTATPAFNYYYPYIVEVIPSVIGNESLRCYGLKKIFMQKCKFPPFCIN